MVTGRSPGRAASLFCLLFYVYAQGVVAQGTSQQQLSSRSDLRCSSSGTAVSAASNVTQGSISSGKNANSTQSYDVSRPFAFCKFVIGAPGRITSITSLVADGDPTSSALLLYDGDDEEPSSLVLRLQGYKWGSGEAAPLFPMTRPLTSRTGSFTVVFLEGSENGGKGLGVAADFASLPGPYRQSPPPVPTAPRGPRSPAQEVIVTSLADLAEAVADSAIGSVILRAHMALTGVPLVVRGAGRNLSISGDAAACGPAAASLSLPLNTACSLDARGLSRHFEVSGGARLRLVDVTLVNGLAIQGGAVLVVGSRLTAVRSHFAHSHAIGDGGAVLALAGSSLEMQYCTFTNATSFAGSGGAVAALFGSNVTLAAAALSGCSAEGGSGVAALYSSVLSVSGSHFERCSAAAGGAILAWNASTLTVTDSVVANCSGSMLGGGLSLKWFATALVSGSSFTDCSSRGDGASVHAWRGSNVTALSTSFLRGTSSASGGGIGAWYARAWATGCRFEGCSSGAQGGAVYLWHSAATLAASDFVNNSAPLDGGAGGALMVAGGTVTRVEDCEAGDIGCSQASASVAGCTFASNSGGQGGAISAEDNAVLAVSASSFVGNAGEVAGGAVAFNSVSAVPLTVRGSAFSGCTAATGGAIAVLSAHSVSVSDTSLVSNAATAGAGGALAVAGSIHTHPCVAGQTVGLSGTRGSIVVASGVVPSTVSFECRWHLLPDSTEADCALEVEIQSIEVLAAISAQMPYEAVSVRGAASGALLFGCADVGCAGVRNRVVSSRDPEGLFLRYQWVTSGDYLPLTYGMRASWRSTCGAEGAVDAPRTFLTVSLDDVMIANNSATGNGGGVFVQGFGTAGSSVLSLTGSVLRNVAGGAGGGLFVTGNVSVLLSSATLLDNTATAGQGGGLLVSSAGSVHLVGVDLSRNRALAGSSLSAAAGAGGALALIDCTEVSAVDCTLSENSAAAAGGAVLGRNVSVLSVASSKLSGNRARGRGGAIAAFAVESAQIYNGSRLSGNAVAPAFGLGAESSSCADADALSRGGAVWIGPGSKVALREVTAEGNEVISGQGGVVYIESGGTLTVLASDFTSNAATGGSVSAAGAIFLDGTARATIASSVFRNNSAHWGGVTASTGFNALLGRWDANLTNVTVVSNSAFAGGAWAVVDDAYSATFIPTCANCTVLGNTASGYGNSLASPPRSFFLSAPAVVRPGSAANLTVSLTDAWNQIIPEVPGAFFELGCVVGARSAPIAAPSGRRLLQAPSSGTEAAALLTTVAVGTSGFCFLGAVGLPHAVYANGAAVFENILLRGTPRTAVTLRVSVFGWPQGSRAPATSFRDVVVEFDLCGRLEVLALNDNSCQCVSGAYRTAAGACQCEAGTGVVQALGRESCPSAEPTLGAGATAVVAVAGCVSVMLLLLTCVLLRRNRRHALQTISVERFMIPSELLKIPRGGSGQDSNPDNNDSLDDVGDGGQIRTRGSIAMLQSLLDEQPEASSPTTGRRRLLAHREISVEYRGMAVVAVDVSSRIDPFMSHSLTGSAPAVPQRTNSTTALVGPPQRRVSLSQRLRRLSGADDSADVRGPRISGVGAWPGDASGRSSEQGSFRQSGGRAGRAGERRILPDIDDNAAPGKRVDWARSNLIELCELRHPNVLATFGASEIRGRQVLVEELHRQNLHEMLGDQDKYLDYSSLASIATGIVAGAQFLHSLSPPRVSGMTAKTIFVDGNFAPKIRLPFLDGLSPLLLARNRPARVSRSGPVHEWTVWDPPETIRDSEWTPPRDVYAFGIILYQLITRKEPFESHLGASNAAAVLRAIAERDLRPTFPESSPKPLRDLSIDCWHRNAARRPRFAEVMDILTSAFEEVRLEMTEADVQRQQRAQYRQILAAMVVDLAHATDDDAIVRAGAEALSQVVPGFVAAGVASVDGDGQGSEQEAIGMQQLVVHAHDKSCETDLESALQPGSHRRRAVMPAPATSLEYLLSHKSQQPVSSTNSTFSMGSFEDWSAVAKRLAKLAVRGEELTRTAAGAGEQDGARARARPAPASSFRQGAASHAGAEVPRAWSKLLRAGPDSHVVGFMVTVWVGSSVRSSQHTEELLQEEFSEALGKALHRVQSQRKELAKERTEGLQKLQQRFLQRMSHGAGTRKTPLNSVIGFTSLALEEERTNPATTEYLTEALGGANALLKLIEKVLEFSRLSRMPAARGPGASGRRGQESDDGGSFTIRGGGTVNNSHVPSDTSGGQSNGRHSAGGAGEPLGPVGPLGPALYERTRVAALAAEVVDAVGVQANRSGVEFVLVVDPELWGEEALAEDASALKQCMVHICDNAVKFTPPGGEVVVTIAIAQDGRAPESSSEVANTAAVVLRVAGRDNSHDTTDSFEEDAMTHRSRKSGMLESRSSQNDLAEGGDSGLGSGEGACGRAGPWAAAVTLPPASSMVVPSRSRGHQGGGARPRRVSVDNGVRRASNSRSVIPTLPARLLEVTVADTGIGIPSSQHHLILKPFGQVLPSSNDAQVEGTGVGLAITKLIVESLNGKIRFTSSEGQGAVFVISVALRRPPGRSLSPMPSTHGLPAAFAAHDGGPHSRPTSKGRGNAGAGGSFAMPASGGASTWRRTVQAQEDVAHESLISWAAAEVSSEAGAGGKPPVAGAGYRHPPGRQGTRPPALTPAISAPAGAHALGAFVPPRAGLSGGAERLSESLLEGECHVIIAVHRPSLRNGLAQMLRCFSAVTFSSPDPVGLLLGSAAGVNGDRGDSPSVPLPPPSERLAALIRDAAEIHAQDESNRFVVVLEASFAVEIIHNVPAVFQNTSRVRFVLLGRSKDRISILSLLPSYPEDLFVSKPVKAEALWAAVCRAAELPQPVSLLPLTSVLAAAQAQARASHPPSAFAVAAATAAALPVVLPVNSSRPGSYRTPAIVAASPSAIGTAGSATSPEGHGRAMPSETAEAESAAAAPVAAMPAPATWEEMMALQLGGKETADAPSIPRRRHRSDTCSDSSDGPASVHAAAEEITLNADAASATAPSPAPPRAAVVARRRSTREDLDGVLQGLRVMVVDDLKMNVKVAISLLRRCGVEVAHVAYNGLEAIDAVREAAFDIIFMDLQMPLCDGLEATRRIRALEEEEQRLRCHIIALTAHTSPEDRAECHGCGMDEFMTKPVSLAVMMETIVAAVSAMRSAGALRAIEEDIRASIDRATE